VHQGRQRSCLPRGDGIVIIDPNKPRGGKEIVSSCPYGAISWNEVLSLPQKCTLCAHMIDGGERTVRCVETCPTSGMVFGDVDDPASAISQFIREREAQVESYRPEFGTQPAIQYIGLPKPFLAERCCSRTSLANV